MYFSVTTNGDWSQNLTYAKYMLYNFVHPI